MRRSLLSLMTLVCTLVLGIAALACGFGAEPTPYPTYTPVPTPTPYPTFTPVPTAMLQPTYTPYPTLTPWPTSTAVPTYTPAPTYTPYPSPVGELRTVMESSEVAQLFWDCMHGNDDFLVLMQAEMEKFIEDDPALGAFTEKVFEDEELFVLVMGLAFEEDPRMQAHFEYVFAEDGDAAEFCGLTSE